MYYEAKPIQVSEADLVDTHDSQSNGYTMPSHRLPPAIEDEDEEEYHNHHQRHRHHGHSHNHGHEHKNYCVLVFVYLLIITGSHLNFIFTIEMYRYFLRDFGLLSNLFIGVMTIVCYAVTHSSNNCKPERLLGHKVFTPKRYYDSVYNPAEKTCNRCQNYKFPRVSHCSTCSSCIYRLDHHCVWTQNCIGLNNYKYFLLFVTYATTACLQYLINSWHYIHWTYDNSSYFWQYHGAMFCIYWLGVTIFTFFMTLMLVALWIAHLFMALTNFSSLESIKTRQCCPVPFLYWRNPQLNYINLYDRGELKNLVNIFGSNLFLVWLPMNEGNELQNDIYPEKMNPEPTQRQIKQWNPYLMKMDFEREHRMKTFIPMVKESMKGKRVRVGDKVVTV